MATAPIARRRAGPQVRPDHRLRLEADRARANGCTSTIARCRNSRATIISRRRAAEAILPVAEQATFQGYRRANGKAGTRNYLGDPDLGELLGDGGAPDRPRGRALGHAGRLSQRRRRHRARARHRLRHGREGRGLRDAQAHAMGLRRQSQHRGRRAGRARLRGVPDRPHERGIRRRRGRLVPEHDDPGDRRHAQDRRGRASQRVDGDAADRRQGAGARRRRRAN